jgi:flagellar biosynthetic protein FliO
MAMASSQPGNADRKAIAAQDASGSLPPGTAAGPPARADYEDLPFMPREREEGEASAPGVGGMLVRTLGALLFIVGLIAAAAWGLRRIGGAGVNGQSGDAPEMVVLGTISLGDRRSLSAVRFGEKILLIGSTSQSITLLAAERLRPARAEVPMRSVAEMLKDDDSTAFKRLLAGAGERIAERSAAAFPPRQPTPANSRTI